jgi:hypothetical protein
VSEAEKILASSTGETFTVYTTDAEYSTDAQVIKASSLSGYFTESVEIATPSHSFDGEMPNSERMKYTLDSSLKQYWSDGSFGTDTATLFSCEGIIEPLLVIGNSGAVLAYAIVDLGAIDSGIVFSRCSYSIKSTFDSYFAQMSAEYSGFKELDCEFIRGKYNSEMHGTELALVSYPEDAAYIYCAGYCGADYEFTGSDRFVKDTVKKDFCSAWLNVANATSVNGYVGYTISSGSYIMYIYYFLNKDYEIIGYALAQLW